MANVTQTIPSYTAGISQQPDEIKVPGQVNIATNVFPDITEGLAKRPGTRFIKQLDAAGDAKDSQDQGKWFHYYRDETEQYLGQISRTGDVNMWKCSDGEPVDVNSSGNSGAMVTYLTHTADQDIQTLTLNDYTYITNRNKPTAMSSTTEDTRPPEAFIELKKVAYASQYAVNIFDNTSTTTVTTATRVSAELINDGMNSLLPNVGTKIYSINGIPEVQKIELSSTSNSSGNPINNQTNGWYRLSDGTTSIEVDVTFGSGSDSYYKFESIAMAFRNHTDYHKLKFSIAVTAEKRDIYTTIDYGSELRLAFKEGGVQNTLATLTKIDAAGGSVTDTYTAARITTGSNSSANNKENLYFRVTVTGQAVPHQRASQPEYFGRYQIVIDLLHGGEGWTQGQVIEVGFKGCSIQVTIDDISTSKVQANLGLVRPIPTSFDAKTVVTAESVIGAIRTDIVGTGNFTDANVQQIGNGLYITRSSNSFNVSSPVGELLNVLTDSVKDIADLPKICKHGYVVKVANSDAEEDDYYVKFFGHNNRDGEGVWEECAKPGTNIAFDAGTMPLQLVRQANGTFTLSTVTWDNAQVGDTSIDGTNPQPSFIGSTINKMMFFRNRLVLLSNENVIMSRPGDFTNFWVKSAIQFTATDPIDISCSSEYPAIIFDGIQVNSGLVLFTKNQQFMLTTDSDVLSPLTAKINFISAYNFNHYTNPFSLGTTVGFIDNVGQHSRLMEMARVLREGEPDVIEQSKVVSELLDKDLNIVSASKENGFVALSEKDKTTLYCYKFFNTSDKRVHQAWFTWKFQWQIQYHFIIDDSLYLVLNTESSDEVANNGKCMLIKLDLKLHSDTLQTYTGTSTDKENIHPVYLDCATEVAINYTGTFSNTPDATGVSWTRPNGGNPVTINLNNHGYAIGQKVKVKPSSNAFEELTINASNFTANSFQVTSQWIQVGNSGTTDVTGEGDTYNASTNKTTFPLPSNWWTTEAEGGDMVLYETGSNDPVGRYAEVTIDGSNVVVDGNWQGSTVVLGILYEMEVEFPRIYTTRVQGDAVRSDTRGSLVLHRNKLNLGASGFYQTILKRKGKPTYTENHESVIADYSEESELPTLQLQTKVIPIYDRNINTTLTLKSKHPTPLTLYSMTWEGDYTNKFYSSV